MWIGTKGGVNYYDGNTFKSYASEKRAVNSILVDSHDVAWFGTQAGIRKFNGKGFENCTISEYCDEDAITAIFEDHLGTFWIGTKLGLNIFDRESGIILSKPSGI